jgi:WD40 repeat protein
MNNEDLYSDIFDAPIDPQFARQIKQIETVYNIVEPPVQLSWAHLQLKMRQKNVSPGQAPQLPRTRLGLWLQWIHRAIVNVVLRLYPAIERELDVSGAQQDALEENMLAEYEEATMPEKRLPVHLARPRSPWLRLLEQGLAALLVLGIIAGWLAVSRLSRPYSGSRTTFSDVSAPALGAPVFTTRGNFSGGLGEWLPDSHTFIALQVDTQKHELEAIVPDVTSGRAFSLYPVLDPSWIAAFNQLNIVQIGKYLIALRPQGNNQATMEIWDVTGQRAVTAQTVPAQIGVNGQVLSPLISASDNEQKFALYTPDGTVAIWDIASGQKLVTCEGKIPLSLPGGIPHLQWYDHDHDLLFEVNEHDISTGHYISSRLDVCNVQTGNSLFSLNDASKQYSGLNISPDSKYLTLYTLPAGGTQYSPDMLEILDAHSGQVLRTYESGEMVASSSWLPDSQHLVSMERVESLVNINNVTVTTQTMQVRMWNVFTNQTTFNLSLSYTGASWSSQLTPNGQYLLVEDSDGSSMEIWQMSNGHKVATVTTPGVYARSDSFFYSNNRQMIIGQTNHFDIWDIATGTLLYKYHGTTPFSIPGVSGSIVFWSPDGKYLAMLAGKAGSIGDGMLSIWRVS